MDKGKRLRLEKIILIALIILATLTRLIIGLRLPMYFLGDAKYDDFMLTEYAEQIIAGNWLGDFTYTTLIKTASFPLLLGLGYVLGVSYPLMLNILYIAAVLVLTLAMNKLIGNKIWSVLFYIFMLYSPVMLHEENVQKLYRGGYIVIFAMFVIAAVIGMFAYYESMSALASFSALLTVSLPIFWYLKEDSVWIIPFVAAGVISAFVRCLLAKKKGTFLVKRFCCYVLPIAVLLISMTAYKSVNNRFYGIAVNNDREGTYFEAVINDLMQVEGASDGPTWVTQEALHRAMAESDTFRQMAYEVDMSCYARLEEDGEVHGDFIIWALREAAFAHRLYEDATSWNEYWQQVHKELTLAYDEGRLNRDNESIYLSGIARGFTIAEMKSYYLGNGKEAALALLTYRANAVTAEKSTGTEDHLDRMYKLARAGYIGDTSTENEVASFEKTVRLANGITSLYSMTGIPVLMLAVAGVILLLVRFVKGIKSRNVNNDGWMLLITMGMALNALLVVFAVMWFCNFLTVYKVYDYSGGAVIFIEIAEAIGLYYFADIIVAYLKKKKDKN